MHEMIYGFAMAVIAGFLLTAVANWTGTMPVRRGALLALCGVWVAGRCVMNMGGLPLWLAGVVDGAFVPVLALALAVPLIGRRDRGNFVFLGVLTFFFACNVAFFAYQDRLAMHMAMLGVLALISLVAGRIIPDFTVAGLSDDGIDEELRYQPWLDSACFASMGALILATAWSGIASPFAAWAAFLASGLHLLRFRNFHTPRVLGRPMLWILQAGYGWLTLGLFMLELSGAGVMELSPAVHALTSGCIGSMCIGMMCRVSLGHTGRRLAAGGLTVFLFSMMQSAAFLRVFGPLFWPAEYTLWISASGLVWALVFATYLAGYARILTGPRPDGAPA